MKQQIKFKQTEIGTIPKDWEVKTVDQIKSTAKSALAMGPFGSNIKKEFFVKEGVPIIRGNNLTSYRFLDEGFVYLTEEKADELKSSNCHPGDLVITHRGTLGQVGLIPKKSRYKRYVISQSGMKLSCDGTQVISEYVFYFLKSPVGQRMLLRNTSQTGVPAIAQPLTSLKKIHLPVPDIEEQKRITKVFEDFNDKIDLLQKQNKTLEAIGKALFKHWFINFEFPNAESKPYKSSGGEIIDSESGKIPKGWKIGEFKDIIHLTMGLSPRGESYNVIEEGIPLINGAADFSDGKIIPKKFTTQPSRVCKKNDLLLCIRGTIGNLTYADGAYCLGRGVAAITPINETYKEYAYFILHHKLNVMISKAAGSVIVGLSKPDILNLKILLPQENIMNIFHTQLESLFAKQELIKSESDNLSKIRDSLLPKLVSGKIRVPVQVN